jgi:hypothetical protein
LSYSTVAAGDFPPSLEPPAAVRAGRCRVRFYLTIPTANPFQVVMPNWINYSFAIALALILAALIASFFI